MLIRYDFWRNETIDWTAFGKYSTFLFAEEAERILSFHPDSNPFFLYLPFQSVHYPLDVPQVYKDLYPNEQDDERKTYLGMISAMDESVGRVIRALKTAGQYDNTIFVFSSDNGGQTMYGGDNYPFRGRKFTLWEGGVRSAGFITGPGIPAGKGYDNLFHAVDWMPTLLDAVGIDRSWLQFRLVNIIIIY